MLEIVIPEQHYEIFDEDKEEFLPPVDIKETKIQIEHSLISIKKWEQKWHKPFLTDKTKTYEELTDYVRCMTLSHGVDPILYNYIPRRTMNKIVDYIKDPMTATWFREDGLVGAQKYSSVGKKEVITAEIIYYWMIALNVPVEFQKWHLNQLLTLIKVLNIKNGKKEKVDSKTAAIQRAALNAQRRAKYNSKG